MKAKPPRIKESLVTDQKGRQIFMLGLILAIALGFTFRSVFSPQSLHQYLLKATESVGEQTQISWSQTHLDLRDGSFLPRFSVAIENLRVVSIDTCIGEPILFSKLVEVPISLFDWLTNARPLNTLILNDSFLEFRKPLECQKKPVEKKTEDPLVGRVVRIKSKEETQNRPPLVLREFIFNNLKVRDSKLIFSDWQMDRIRFQIRDNQPWYVSLEALFPIPETEGIDSVESQVELKVLYKEFPTPMADVNLQGHWREGSFKAEGTWDPTRETWKLTSQFDHFPFQFLKLIAQKAKAPWNWPSQPMWFSFNMDARDQKWDLANVDLLLRSLQIEGDLGELKVPDLRVISLKPFRVEPFVFQAEKIDLSPIFGNLLRRSEPLASLGQLSGQGQWLAQNDFRFLGQLENIHLQTPSWLAVQTDWVLRSDSFQANLIKSRWNIQASELQIQNKKLGGDLNLQGDQDLKRAAVKFHFQMEQAPARLFPWIGSVDIKDLSLSGAWGWSPAPGESAPAQWQLGWSEARNEVVEMQAYSGQIKRQKDLWELKSKLGQLKVMQKLRSLESSDLKPISWPLEVSNSNQVLTWNERGLSWIFSSSGVQSDGKRSESGQLNGRLQISNLHYNLTQESLEQPLLIESRSDLPSPKTQLNQ